MNVPYCSTFTSKLERRKQWRSTDVPRYLSQRNILQSLLLEFPRAYLCSCCIIIYPIFFRILTELEVLCTLFFFTLKFPSGVYCRMIIFYGCKKSSAKLYFSGSLFFLNSINIYNSRMSRCAIISIFSGNCYCNYKTSNFACK